MSLGSSGLMAATDLSTFPRGGCTQGEELAEGAPAFDLTLERHDGAGGPQQRGDGPNRAKLIEAEEALRNEEGRRVDLIEGVRDLLAAPAGVERNQDPPGTKDAQGRIDPLRGVRAPKTDSVALLDAQRECGPDGHSNRLPEIGVGPSALTFDQSCDGGEFLGVRQRHSRNIHCGKGQPLAHSFIIPFRQLQHGPVLAGDCGTGPESAPVSSKPAPDCPETPARR